MMSKNYLLCIRQELIFGGKNGSLHNNVDDQWLISLELVMSGPDIVKVTAWVPFKWRKRDAVPYRLPYIEFAPAPQTA